MGGLMAKTPRIALPTAARRLGVLSLEHARLTVEGNSVVAHIDGEVLSIPVETLSAIFLGPGTSVTQRVAVKTADAGTTLVWTGSGVVRSYGSVTPLAVQSHLLHKQVESWADPRQRLGVARRMYAMRFPGDNTSRWTMAQLRAAEGRRVRDRYREVAAAVGISWTKRETDWDRSDDLNRAITASYQALYGAALGAILALGLHPGLGFIHTGQLQSLVYDIADLHKTGMGLDTAFQAYRHSTGDVERDTRAAMNRAMCDRGVISAMIAALHEVLDAGDVSVEALTRDDLQLFDLRGNLPAGQNYGEDSVPF
jgi:CRISPR-associated protein Cas1